MNSAGRTTTLFTVSLVMLIAGGATGEPRQTGRMEEILETPVTVVFKDIHVKDVLKFISRTYHVNILFGAAVSPPAKPGEVPGPLAPGEVRSAAAGDDYATDGMIKNVNLKNVKLKNALTAILTPLGLTYAVHQDLIRVSKLQQIELESLENLETRIYELPGRTLPDKNARYQDGAVAEVDLMSILRRVTPMIVEPQSGRLLSYMRFNLETNQVVVHNTPTNLNRLEQLLDLLLGDPDGR